MIGLGFVPARRPLPLGRNGPMLFLPWVVAAMAYLAGLSGFGLLAVNDVVDAAERSLAGTLTIEVPADASDARRRTVLALLRQTPGVKSADVLPAAETARLLEPWLGSPLSLGELPMPRLIDVRLDGGARLDLPTLRRQLATVVPDARLDEHGRWLGGLRQAARPVSAVLWGLIAGSLVVIGVVSVFAGLAALSVHRSTVELLHLLGAADRDIGRPFAVRLFVLALPGGAAGAAAALLTLAVLPRANRLIELPAPIAGLGAADWRLWAILVGTVLASALVAAAAGWIGVRRRLARLA